MKRRTLKDKELADRTTLARAWHKWHVEQLEEALAGVHGAVLERLMAHLKELCSGSELTDFIAARDWNRVDANTRMVALHEINRAITKLRERADEDQRSASGAAAECVPASQADYHQYPAPRESRTRLRHLFRATSDT